MTEANSTNGGGRDGIDVKALIRSSRRAERTVPVCLRGDLVAEFEELDRRLATIATDAPARANDQRLNKAKTAAQTEAQQLVEQMRHLQDQMAAATVTFRLRALAPKRWAELRAAHPPRKGQDGKVFDDDLIGVNAETFFVPLIRESVVSPVLDDDDWAILLGDPATADGDDAGEEAPRGLTDIQLDMLGGTAWRLNRSEVDIPFSRAASRILQSYASDSRRRNAPASP